MSNFKVGDRVKIVSRGKNNHTGSLGVSGTYQDLGIGMEGIIGDYLEDHKYPYMVSQKEGEVNSTDNLYYGRFKASNLELVQPSTKTLTLEEVYTVAPIPELRKVIEDKGGVVAHPDYPISEKGRKECVFLHDGILDTIGNTPPAPHLKGKTEVSIPVFLDLLASYTPPKKVVTITLNSSITATVEEGNEVVKVTYSGDTQKVTKAQLKELEEGLNTPKNDGGFIEGEAEFCLVPTKEIAQGIEDLAKVTGLPIFLKVTAAGVSGDGIYKVQ